MSCTTILVGKKASYDGSTMVARNHDSGPGSYTPKKFTIISRDEQDEIYHSKISHVEIHLPKNPMRFSATPNVNSENGIWASAGVNEENVAMTATETITTNPRVLGADPLVKYQKADESRPELVGGIGEEDIVYITLPYIHSAREGVERLGKLLEEYGTYEMNGIAFQDLNEIWWFETIGGHHWIARKVPDDVYVVMPNQLGIDKFDLNDALFTKKNYMCSSDMKEFIEKNHLDLSLDDELNPRETFGSHEDADHVYNTPRAWYMLRYMNPNSRKWDEASGENCPRSDSLPWCMIPERKITVEDIKYLLSSHYQGTPYDPYLTSGDISRKGIYRSIGINRNDFLGLIQLRPYIGKFNQAIEWIAFASNAFNTMVPFYTNVSSIPKYLSETSEHVSTEYFYWASRLIAGMTDASYHKSANHIEHYQMDVLSASHRIISKYDEIISKADDKNESILLDANNEISEMLKKETDKTIGNVLYELSNLMKNSYSRSDA